MLADGEATVQKLRAVEDWRSWAQFVYLGGGPVLLDDDALRQAVNAIHDADVLAARKAAAEQALVTLREAIGHLEQEMRAYKGETWHTVPEQIQDWADRLHALCASPTTDQEEKNQTRR